jgi:hypothetical protein
MEHISRPIQRILRVLEVVYHGDNYDEAIEIGLRRLGLREDQVQTIIAMPQGMTNDDDPQMKLFD